MKNKQAKLEMISAASIALEYLNQHKNADIEEVMKHAVKSISSKGKLKLAGIAAANHVLKLKEKNPKATQKQAMQSLSDNINIILDSIV